MSLPRCHARTEMAVEGRETPRTCIISRSLLMRFVTAHSAHSHDQKDTLLSQNRAWSVLAFSDDDKQKSHGTLNH